MNAGHPQGTVNGPPVLLSVVVPMFNEQESLPLLHRRLLDVVGELPGGAEIVYVDDGSRDDTPKLLKALRVACPIVSVVRFSRNFGKEQAITAGLHLARGAVVVVMDSDLQHPPERIPDMIEAWRGGADVVNMRRRSRADESWLKRQAAGSFYRIINSLSDMPIPADVGDFRLFSRRAVDALNQLPERNRFMKGLFAWIGFPTATLEYDVAERAGGTSKWRFRALWHFAVEGITAFSIQPLKLASKVGLLSSSLAFAYAFYIFVRALAYGDPVAGYPTLIVVILMLGGLQLLAIGVLGEYIGRLSLESKRRPLYLIENYEPALVHDGRHAAGNAGEAAAIQHHDE
ncbi:MAG: glycosyltransferase family 2 protein [Pelomonas sp.]|nr:glycosyltransferase family 2 protein [Roseateles sp.]